MIKYHELLSDIHLKHHHELLSEILLSTLKYINRNSLKFHGDVMQRSTEPHGVIYQLGKPVMYHVTLCEVLRYIFGWNVLHSMMFQVYFRKIQKFNFNNLNERVMRTKWMSKWTEIFWHGIYRNTMINSKKRYYNVSYLPILGYTLNSFL